MTGGTGNDTMDGGAGTDMFVFGPGFGSDQINGFDANPGMAVPVRTCSISTL